MYTKPPRPTTRSRHQPRLTRAERESTIVFNDLDAFASVSTTSPIVARRWQRRGVELVEQNGTWRGSVPKSNVLVRVLSRRHANCGSFGRRSADESTQVDE